MLQFTLYSTYLVWIKSVTLVNFIIFIIKICTFFLCWSQAITIIINYYYLWQELLFCRSNGEINWCYKAYFWALKLSKILFYRIEDQAFPKEIRKNATIPHQHNRIHSANLALKILQLLTEKKLSTDYGEPPFNLVTDGFLDTFKPLQLSLIHHA